MAKIDFGPIYGPDIEEATIQLKMIMDAKDDTDEWKQWAVVAKKSLERSLYRYVINGCVKEGRMLNAYPELKTQYDPDSTDLLDKKIEVLLKIAEMGPDGDYQSIEGFEDILEFKLPDGMQEIVIE